MVPAYGGLGPPSLENSRRQEVSLILVHISRNIMLDMHIRQREPVQDMQGLRNLPLQPTKELLQGVWQIIRYASIRAGEKEGGMEGGRVSPGGGGDIAAVLKTRLEVVAFMLCNECEKSVLLVLSPGN